MWLGRKFMYVHRYMLNIMLIFEFNNNILHMLNTTLP